MRLNFFVTCCFPRLLLLLLPAAQYRSPGKVLSFCLCCFDHQEQSVREVTLKDRSYISTTTLMVEKHHLFQGLLYLVSVFQGNPSKTRVFCHWLDMLVSTKAIGLWQTLGGIRSSQDVVALVFDHDFGKFVPKRCWLKI